MNNIAVESIRAREGREIALAIVIVTCAETNETTLIDDRLL
jgi:hypothetical protein